MTWRLQWWLVLGLISCTVTSLGNENVLKTWSKLHQIASRKAFRGSIPRSFLSFTSSIKNNSPPSALTEFWTVAVTRIETAVVWHKPNSARKKLHYSSILSSSTELASLVRLLLWSVYNCTRQVFAQPRKIIDHKFYDFCLVSSTQSPDTINTLTRDTRIVRILLLFFQE